MSSLPIKNRATIKTAENSDFSGFPFLNKTGTINVFSNAPKVGKQFIVRCFSNAIVFAPDLTNTSPTEPPERIENDIKEFSAKSRKRLFDIFAKLDYESYGIPVFISATYHYDAPDTRIKIKTMIQNYFRYLKHKLPAFHYITKLEYQQRGIPHFHFIFLPLEKSEDFSKDEIIKIIKTKWIEMKNCKCEFCKLYSIDVRKVNNYKQAIIYISKEIAKIQDRYEDHDLGRIWSTSQNLRIKEFYKFETTEKFYDEILKFAIANVREKTRSEIYLKSLRWTYNPSTLYLSLKDIEHLILKEIKSSQNSERKTVFDNLKKMTLKDTVRKHIPG